MSTDAQIRADQAQQVLDNPAFQDAYQAVVDGLVETIAATAIADSESRNQLGLQLGAAAAFKEAMVEMINDGKLERDEELRQQRIAIDKRHGAPREPRH